VIKKPHKRGGHSPRWAAEPEKIKMKRTVYFGIKLYNDQPNAQVLLIYLFTSALHVSGFLLALLQRQVYKSGSGLNVLGMVSAPRR
jgi:hypothetical protein